jgi:hypothetical protein
MRRRAGLIVAVAILVVAAGTVVGWRWWHDRSPYGPKALGATATLRLVDQVTADAAMSPVNAEHAGDGDQIFLGRVTWVRPPGLQDDGSFRVVILDKRTRRMPGFISVTSPRPDEVVVGSDEALDVAEERYPWLQGIGPREINGSFGTAGAAITVSSLDASPVTFAIVLHPARPGTPPELAVPHAPAAVSDLLVALINVGSDGQVYRAQRLLN